MLMVALQIIDLSLIFVTWACKASCRSRISQGQWQRYTVRSQIGAVFENLSTCPHLGRPLLMMGANSQLENTSVQWIWPNEMMGMPRRSTSTFVFKSTKPCSG